MNLSTITLHLMRGSAGAFITAATFSGVAQADNTISREIPSAVKSSLTTTSERGIPNAEPPKKAEEEKKPEKDRDPCPFCGRG